MTSQRRGSAAAMSGAEDMGGQVKEGGVADRQDLEGHIEDEGLCN